MYIPTIGLEIHIELKTKTKMFCPCLNDPDERKPNVNVCPICMGHPGVLPTINKEAINSVLKLGLAIGGKIREKSHFDRKSYFYPDLPKGYQISQYDEPLVESGMVEGVRITRVHLEEDAGRLSHEFEGRQDSNWSYVDFNRAGVPLMELVTEPDIKNGKEAVQFARSFQRLMRYLGASDADMEKGQMRIEVNISLKKNKNDEYGTKVEVKNINSFRAVEKSIEYEIKRQSKILDSGKDVVHETRGWSDLSQKTESQRSKELSHDYRYFPEPDLPSMTFEKSEIEKLIETLPELPEQKKMRFMREFELSEDRVGFLIDDPFWADYFEKSASELGTEVEKPNYELLLNYITSDLWGLIQKEKVKKEDLKITPENFADLVSLVQKGEFSSRIAKDVLVKMFSSGEDPRVIMQNESLSVISDESELLSIVKSVIKENPKVVEDYKNGKINVLKFLVGQGMAKTRGQADPKKLQEIFEKELKS